jgi:hypothetical protein
MRHEREEIFSNGTKKKVHILALGYCAKYLGGKIDLGKNHIESKWRNINKLNPEEYFVGGWLEGVKEYQFNKNSFSE